MARPNKTVLWGLWFLRFGLGIFLLLMSLDKIISPENTVAIFSKHYLLDISPSIAMILGSLELSLSLLIILGMYKTLSYGAGLLVQAASTLAYYEELLAPFDNHHLIIAKSSLLFSFIALFIVRNIDTQWALAKRNNLFARH